MILAWLESAAAEGTPAKSGNNSDARIQRSRVREVMCHPLVGTWPVAYCVRRLKTEPGCVPVDTSNGLARHRGRQVRDRTVSLAPGMSVNARPVCPGAEMHMPVAPLPASK